MARSKTLAEAAQKVAAEFEFTSQDVNNGVQEFLTQMGKSNLGLYMAVDLGGTNFRVCSIQLHGNSTFSLTQSKVAIPRDLMVAKTSKELFAFLAKQIEAFLKAHHNEHYLSHLERRGSTAEGFHEEEIFSLGFTFSFPVHQVGINRGTLIRWTKGFDIADAVDKDVCAMLQVEIDALNLPVKVAALVNDTVGTLMARSYTSPGKTGTLLGAIFGTGTNGAYVEKLSRISKLSSKDYQSSTYDTSTGEMVVNTEWGSFDNTMKILPRTPYDDSLDAESNNPGIQMFEKRVSGMFLGEILRRAILGLMQDANVPLFSDAHSDKNDLHSTTTVAEDSQLYNQWGLDTSFLSTAHGDRSDGLRLTRQALDKDLGVSAASAEDAEAVKALATAVGRRAARLSAVALGAVVISSGRLGAGAMHPKDHPSDAANGGGTDFVDIGVDGSLVEFYPGFEDYVREALREIKQIGTKGESRIRIGIAKDGSGVGAALIALIAQKMGVDAPS
ncbi:MAG: glucokinase [Chrysothrix sp. TS-e1954]|nr:MAG: glucokinase [Chrysothrix sp. TS-e1954]